MIYFCMGKLQPSIYPSVPIYSPIYPSIRPCLLTYPSFDPSLFIPLPVLATVEQFEHHTELER